MNNWLDSIPNSSFQSFISIEKMERFSCRRIVIVPFALIGLFYFIFYSQVFESQARDQFFRFPSLQKNKATSYNFGGPIGLPHVYGPIPLDLQNRKSYQFYRVDSLHGAFLPFELHRISELPKQDFESLISKALPSLLEERLRPYLAATLGLAESYQVDPFWALAVMWTESHFNPQAESHMRAQGLMQVLPSTGIYIYDLLGRPSDAVNERVMKDPLVNIEMGIFYLRRLLNRFDGDYKLATVAYNMGTSRVLRRLNRGLPVGVNNHYLNKVSHAYDEISKNYRLYLESTPAAYQKSLAVKPDYHFEGPKSHNLLDVDSLVGFRFYHDIKSARVALR